MPNPDLASFRSKIDLVLGIAPRDLRDTEPDHLRWAIREARKERLDHDSFVRRLSAQNEAIAPLGSRLYQLLLDADAVLPSEQVAELEAMIDERLDVGF